MLWQLVLLIEADEIPCDIYFKREEAGQQFCRTHYVFIGELVWKLRKTRDYDVIIRRYR